MNAIAEIPGAELERQIRSAAKPVLVFLYTSWCAQCRMLEPSLARLASELEQAVRIVKVNLDGSPELAECYGVFRVPTLIVFECGVPVDSFDGWPPYPELKARLQGVLADYATPLDA